MKFINKLFRDEAGATAIEYGLIAALIAVAAITAMQGLGNELKTTFNTATGSMSTANQAAAAKSATAERPQELGRRGNPPPLFFCPEQKLEQVLSR